MKRAVFQGSVAALSSLLFLAGSFSPAQAQVPTSIDGVDVTVTPQNPAPGQDVQISLQSYLSDINSAYITWVVDGKKASEGVGDTGIAVTAPPLGQTSTVAILISTEDGKSIQKSVTIKSGSVDLIWESDGYAPPLYEGKQPFAYEDAVTVVAMPHLADASGDQIDPSTLVYDWKNGTTVLQSQSGYGKQSVQLQGSVIPRPMEIHVDVSTRDGSETASGDVTLTTGNPFLIFYKDDPLYGVLYNAALGTQASFSTEELTLLAAPYSFNTSATDDPAMQYAWTINGQSQDSLSSSRSVTLRVQDPSSNGTYPIQLQLQNLTYILEGATQAITVMFEGNKNTNNAQAEL